MNKPGKLTVLIGLPRSGKSTYAKEWMTHPWGLVSDVYIKPRVIVNSDTVRLALHGQRYLRSAEPFVHACTKVMVKSLHMQGFHVLVDETNSTVGSIKQWLEIDVNAEFIFVDTPVDECERRALACGHDDLVTKGVIRRMYENLRKLQFYAHEQWDINLLPEDKPEDYELLECRLRCAVEKIRQEIKNNV